ncbi:MAG: hypothetical protein IJ387_03990 [Thermoguttaceae bacterium]|nr:hypothetical protein [Thermoguttaceae bacterium]
MNANTRERIRKFVAYLTGAYFIWMAYMLLTPQPSFPKVGWGIDLRHIGAFAVLGFGVGVARRNWTTGRWRVLLLLWAVGSECLQELGRRFLNTGRCFESIDVFQNVVGILLGLEIGRLFGAWTQKWNDSETVEKSQNNAA